MPTYDYFCNKCQQSFEVAQSMKDAHFKTCPEACCRMETWGHGDVKRQMGTGAGLIFKGSGFYITDYRSENYKEGAKKDSPSGGTPPAEEGGKATEAAKPKPDAPTAAIPKPETPKSTPSNSPGSAT